MKLIVDRYRGVSDRDIYLELPLSDCVCGAQLPGLGTNTRKDRIKFRPTHPLSVL